MFAGTNRAVTARPRAIARWCAQQTGTEERRRESRVTRRAAIALLGVCCWLATLPSHVAAAPPEGASSSPALSDDGRYVAFVSAAANLVASDTNGVADVFVRDRLAETISRVSVSTAGAQANGASAAPAISDDGQFVTFESSASNLVAGDTNGVRDVFLFDTSANTLVRASVSRASTQLAEGGHSATPPTSPGTGAQSFT